MKTIAILLTCHNRKNKTLHCLSNLFKQNEKFDVYLVDDGCTDGTATAIRIQFPTINIIEGNGNLFWNRGMYLAWQRASIKEYDYYIWLNDDTFLFENSLSMLLESSKKFNDSAIIIGACCDPEDKQKTTFSGIINGKELSPNGKGEQECKFFGGNFVLIPKYVFNKCGLLDPYYQHSFGDTDYAVKAQKNKIKIYLAPQYAGTCVKDAGAAYIPWLDMSKSFKERWRALHSPLGYSIPKEVFYFYKKKNGFFIAFLHYCSVYYRFFIKRKWDK